jgi:hypothetical protein
MTKKRVRVNLLPSQEPHFGIIESKPNLLFFSGADLGN